MLEHADEAMELLKKIDAEYQFVEPFSEAVKMIEAEMDRLYKENRELRKGIENGQSEAAA